MIILFIRDQGNITFSTSAITTSNAIMNLPGPVEMEIDDFNVSNVDNYNDMRGHTIPSEEMLLEQFLCP